MAARPGARTPVKVSAPSELMEFFIRGVRWLSTACGIIAALALIAAVLVVCEMVVLRYVLQESTVWQTEFVTFAIVGATFMGSPYVLQIKGHVNVDLLPLYLGHRGRFALALFASIAAFIFCAVLAWAGWLYFHEALVKGWRTETVWALPLWIPTLPLPLGIGILALQYVVDIICLLTRRELPFGIELEGSE